MRIAVPCEDGKVSQHYGSAAAFTIYEVENGAVLGSETIKTDGKGHYYMVQFLVTHNVDLVLCRSCGSPAQKTLQIAGIRLATGAEGETDAAVDKFLKTCGE